MGRKDRKTFIVDFYSWLFGMLRKISLFALARRMKWTHNKKWAWLFVEIWTVVHTGLAILLALLVHFQEICIGHTVFLLYGGLRVFEVTIYQINVFLFDRRRALLKGKEYKILSPTRSFVLLMHNYIEVIFWFLSAFVILNYCETLSFPVESFILSMRSAALSIFSFSFEGAESLSIMGSLAILFHSLISIFFTVVLIGHVIGYLPVPDSYKE